MRSFILCLGLAALLSFLILPAAATAQEEDIPPDKAPKAVLDAIKTRFKGADITGAAKELDEGKTVYEVSFKFGGTTYDVMLTPEGSIFLIEKKILAKDLPKQVNAAIQTKYPKATYAKTEEMTKVDKTVEKLAYYEVLLVTADKKRLEVEVSPEGKIIKEEKKGPKDVD